jgi:hypothetical protein
MQEELQRQIENRLETIDDTIQHQIGGLCELSSMVTTVSYLLFLATNEKSKIKDLQLEQAQSVE